MTLNGLSLRGAGNKYARRKLSNTMIQTDVLQQVWIMKCAATYVVRDNDSG